MEDSKMSAEPNVHYVGQPAPPPYSYQPPPPAAVLAPGVTVANVTATVIVSNNVGPEPMNITCPSCHYQIKTRTEKNASTKTHIIACILFCFVCWPCVCLPYCMDSCNNIDHYCPNCNAYIGGYKN